MNFSSVFVTVSPRRPWDRGWCYLALISVSEVHKKTGAELVSSGIVGLNFGTKQKQKGYTFMSRNKQARKYLIGRSYKNDEFD